MQPQKDQTLSRDDICAMLHDVVDASRISGVVVHAEKIGLVLECEAEQAEQGEALSKRIKACLLQDERIHDVTIVLSAERDGETQPQTAPKKPAQWSSTPLPHVKRIVTVASGKGGVGKSTVTALLAVSYMKKGLRVGILDADIYGPSMAHMFGLSHQNQPELDGNLMVPPEVSGIAIMSLGLLLDPSKAAIMRGAMVSKTLQQMLRGVRWGTEEKPLDVLLIDMPPGTGDVHLSLVQSVPMAQHQGGAVLVTTPQEVAVIDARKCAAMFAKVSVPLIGVIENMSYFEDEQGNQHRLFGEGGGATLAEQYGTRQIAQLPIDQSLGRLADAGQMHQTDVMLSIDI